MVNRYQTSNEPARGTVRLIWMVAFVATVALIALLGLARSAQALTLPDPLGVEAPVADSDEPEDEAEAEAASEELEECEGGEPSEGAPEEESDELGEGEGAEECGTAGPRQAPAQCLLTTAVTTVSASRSGKVRLFVRYTAVSPITVDVDYWLRGAKGPLTMPGGKEHFKRRGVYRETSRVTGLQLAKVMAAKSFTIRLRPLGAPGYCRPFEESQLEVRRLSHAGLTWTATKPRR